MHQGTWVFRCTRDTVGVAYLPLAGLTIQQSTTQLCKIEASRPVPDMENSKTQKSWESGSENKSTWPVYPAGSLHGVLLIAIRIFISDGLLQKASSEMHVT